MAMAGPRCGIDYSLRAVEIVGETGVEGDDVQGVGDVDHRCTGADGLRNSRSVTEVVRRSRAGSATAARNSAAGLSAVSCGLFSPPASAVSRGEAIIVSVDHRLLSRLIIATPSAPLKGSVTCRRS